MLIRFKQLPQKPLGLLAGVWLLFMFGLAGSLTLAAARPEQRDGVLHVVWGDPRPGTGRPPPPEIVLREPDGAATRLVLAEKLVRQAGGLSNLDRRPARVTGQPSSQPGRGASRGALEVESIQPAAANPAAGSPPVAPATTSLPWINVLCKFNEPPYYEPKSPAYFDQLIGDTYPGLNHYWREISYGRTDISGSRTAGWFVLPQPRSYYLENGYFSFALATQDCTSLAVSSVYFPAFAGINLMFNDELDGAAWGGSDTLTLNGVSKLYYVTWQPPWSYANQGAIAHEMGHGFGLGHSADNLGTFNSPYNNYWDMMSNLFGHCPPNDSTFGCVAQHPLAYGKDRLGWIAPDRKYTYSPAQGARTVTLTRSTQAGSGYWLAQVPAANSPTRFFTLELRDHSGYDAVLNAPAFSGPQVIIHEVDTTRPEPAWVVDADGNGDTSDGGAMWSAGELFEDAAGGISVYINSTAYGSATVTIGTNPAPALTGLSPATVTAGSGALTLYVQGSGFVPASRVYWNGQERPATLVSATTLSAAIAAGDVATAGTAAVQVITPGPGGGASGVLNFSILNPVPALTGLSQSSTLAGSPGFTLSLYGSNFTSGSVARWDGNNRATTFVNGGQLNAGLTVADLAAPGSHTLTVYTPGPGGGTSGGQTFQALGPELTGLSPAAIKAGSPGFNLEVYGTNFGPGAYLRWNGAGRSPAVSGADKLVVPIAAGDIAAEAQVSLQVVQPGQPGQAAILSNPLVFPVVSATVCNKLVVTRQDDADSCGTLRHALNYAAGPAGQPPMTITLNIQDSSRQIYLTSLLPPIAPNVTVFGGCNSAGPLVTLNMYSVPRPLPPGSAYLTLGGGVTLQGLKLTGTGDRAIKSGPGRNTLRCLKILR